METKTTRKYRKNGNVEAMQYMAKFLSKFSERKDRLTKLCYKMDNPPFFFRYLNETEKKCSISKKELLAEVWGLAKFHF